jgi:hypothetical protein
MMPGRLAQMVDADAVAPGLFVGSRPAPGHYRWIHAIVLCAKEYQPSIGAFPGVIVVRVLLDDDPSRPMRRDEVATAISGARSVARFLAAGQRVLVTCHQGWNRSGLVAALAMHQAFGLDADEVIERVRDARGPYALSNPNFENLIERVTAKSAKTQR